MNLCSSWSGQVGRQCTRSCVAKRSSRHGNLRVRHTPTALGCRLEWSEVLRSVLTTGEVIEGCRGSTRGVIEGCGGSTRGVIEGCRGSTRGVIEGCRGSTRGVIEGCRGSTRGTSTSSFLVFINGLTYNGFIIL